MTVGFAVIPELSRGELFLKTKPVGKTRVLSGVELYVSIAKCGK